MRRREFIALLGCAAGAWSFGGYAQQARKKVWRLGVLLPGAPPEPLLEAIREGLRDRGYMEGRDVALEVRWAEGKLDRLNDLAKELVGDWRVVWKDYRIEGRLFARSHGRPSDLSLISLEQSGKPRRYTRINDCAAAVSNQA